MLPSARCVNGFYPPVMHAQLFWNKEGNRQKKEREGSEGASLCTLPLPAPISFPSTRLMVAEVSSGSKL